MIEFTSLTIPMIYPTVEFFLVYWIIGGIYVFGCVVWCSVINPDCYGDADDPWWMYVVAILSFSIFWPKLLWDEVFDE